MAERPAAPGTPAWLPGPGPADDRHAGFERHGCASCGATVLVAKFSPQHTSVQWSPAAVRACTEFSAALAAGQQSALVSGCASLRASIERAVTDGRLLIALP